MLSTELPTLPDSAEDFLIFRKNKPIRVHKFNNLPDSGNFLSIKLYVILKIFLIDEENLPDYKMLYVGSSVSKTVQLIDIVEMLQALMAQVIFSSPHISLALYIELENEYGAGYLN